MSVTTYTTVNGQILCQSKDGVVSHFVSDPLGSVVMVRDTAGNTVYEAEYDPYCNVQSETGTNPSEFGYVGTLGYVKDSATSLYVRARYLLTNLGRWLTKDPLWPTEPGFVYAGADPIRWRDLDGTRPGTIPMPPWPLIVLLPEIMGILAALGITLAEAGLIALLLAALILVATLTCLALRSIINRFHNQPGCKPGDSCLQLANGYNARMLEIAARLMEMAKCYPKPESGHVEQVAAKWNALVKCACLAQSRLRCDPDCSWVSMQPVRCGMDLKPPFNLPPFKW